MDERKRGRGWRPRRPGNGRFVVAKYGAMKYVQMVTPHPKVACNLLEPLAVLYLPPGEGLQTAPTVPVSLATSLVTLRVMKEALANIQLDKNKKSPHHGDIVKIETTLDCYLSPNSQGSFLFTLDI